MTGDLVNFSKIHDYEEVCRSLLMGIMEYTELQVQRDPIRVLDASLTILIHKIIADYATQWIK